MINSKVFFRQFYEVSITWKMGHSLSSRKNPPMNVDAYIQACPKEIRSKLQQIRSIIKKTAPAAQERISYGMPYYSYNGRLAYFAAFKNHISLFVPPPVIDEHKNELKEYATTKATLHFSFDKPLPAALIKKLVKSRMKKNEAKKKGK